MTNIYCVKNDGYKWTFKDNIHFKGYIFQDELMDEIFRGDDAINFLKKIKSYDEFLQFLSKSDGIFSIIIQKNNELWFAVDIARSMPLYFSTNASIVSDSSEYIRKEMHIDRTNINENRALEMLATEFIAHNNTMYDSINQLDCGQAGRIFSKKVQINNYFHHFAETKDISYYEAKALLTESANKMIEQLIRVVNNRPIVLSLSGGYDSRFLACLLRNHGVTDVLCYTYGKETSPDVVQSKKIAEALGFQWSFVSYTDDMMQNILTEDNAGYFDLCNEHDYIIYLQNYAAVKYLHKTNILKPDSVFITGLCHDMPSGAYVKNRDEIEHMDESIDGVAKYIGNKRYIKYKLRQEAIEKFQFEIKENIMSKGITVNDYQDFVRAVDAIETSYDHSRRFLAMNSVHSYFGYEWLLPCWNKNLLLFWYSLPYKYRIRQTLYEDFLLNDVCKKYNLNTKKIIQEHAKNPVIASYLRRLGGYLAMAMYTIGLPIRRKTDINNFALLEILLFKRIKQTDIIKWQRASLSLLLTIYIMERRYGKDCLESINIHVY